MKILLIDPQYTKDKNKWEKQGYESLAVAYLTTALQKNNIDVLPIHGSLFQISAEEVIDIVKRMKYTIVGLSCPAQRLYEDTRILAEKIKGYDKSIIVILGGHFATIAYDVILNDCNVFDYIVKGYGEDVLPQLVKNIYNKKSSENVDGIAYRINNKIVDNPIRNSKSLDDYEYPDRSYISHIAKNGKHAMEEIAIIATRGCPYRCVYCSVKHGELRRSPENIVSEMVNLNMKWGVKKYNFKDDLLFGPRVKDKEWAYLLSALIKEKLTGIEMRGMARSDAVDEKLFKQLFQSGFNTIMLGVESGSSSILKRFKKKCSVEQHIHAINILRNIGIHVLYGFIMFEPDMNWYELNENIQFLKNVGQFTRHNLTDTLNIYYGSDLYEKWVNEKRIDKYFGFNHHPFDMKDPKVKLFYDIVQQMKRHYFDNKILIGKIINKNIRHPLIYQEAEVWLNIYQYIYDQIEKECSISNINIYYKDMFSDFIKDIKEKYNS